MLLPVRWHRAGGTWHGLIERVVSWLGEPRTVGELAGPVVVEPVLPGLEALDHRMVSVGVVSAGVLAGRVVAAADVTASRAAPEVEPPPGAFAGQALDTAGPAGRNVGVDVGRCGCQDAL